MKHYFRLVLVFSFSILFGNGVAFSQYEKKYEVSYDISLAEQVVAKGGSRLFYVQVSTIPNDMYIKSVEAKFEYIAYNLTQNYVSARFQKGSDPSTTGPVLVNQGSLASGNPGTTTYKQFNDWNNNYSPNDKYYFRFNLASGSPTTCTIKKIWVTITCGLKTPDINLPINKSIYNKTKDNVYLEWSSISGAQNYKLIMKTVANYPIFEEVLGNVPNYTISDLKNYSCNTYIFYVMAKANGIWSQYSTGREFMADSQAVPPKIISPNNGDCLKNSSSQLLEWNPYTIGIARFYLKLVQGNDPNGTPIFTDEKAFQTKYYLNTNNLAPGKYYWSVRVIKDASNNGLNIGYNQNTHETKIGWSQYTTYSFDLAPSTPTGFTVNYGDDCGFNLTWNNSQGADSYEIFWGTEDAVTEYSEPLPPTTSLSFFHNGQVDDSTYYYRIRASYNGCYSDLSSTISKKFELPSAQIDPSDEQFLCEGDSVILTATEATSYLWNTEETTQSITVKTSGEYSVTVTNENYCSKQSEAIKVTVNPLPSAQIDPSDEQFICEGDSVILTATEATSYLWNTEETTQSITVKTSGEYSVTVNNEFGCFASSTPVIITVDSLPTAKITPSSDTTICRGDILSLKASEADFYLWNTDDTTQTIDVSLPGTYFVTCKNKSGCEATSDTLTVLVKSSPIAEITPSGETSICQGESITLAATDYIDITSYEWSTGETGQSIVVDSAGDYFLTVTNELGCSAQSSITTVTVNPLPIAKITPNGDQSICEGESVTLTADDANSYKWNTGDTSQSIVVNSEGDYFVIVTNEFGCSDTSSSTKVTVHKAPEELSIDSLPGDILVARAKSTLKLSYQWYRDGVIIKDATNQNYIASTPSGTHTYYVEVTNECGQSTSETISHTDVIEGQTEANSLIIIPNPAFDYITIEGYYNELKIYDIIGREIISIEQAYNQKIDISSLKPGVYLIKSGSNVAKFIKI
jgi:hypothetical protein